MKPIHKILIANRGEIAVRIMRTAARMKINTVAIYDDIEKEAFHTKCANEAFSLGSGNLSSTYLNIKKIINIAKSANCDAIHPGYGFLAENAAFAQACTDAQIIFIGPNASTIQLMGNKIEARSFVQTINEPVPFGVTGSISNIKSKASDLPYPVLVKAAAGGGGKGMKIVHSASELDEALESAQREAKNYFGDKSVYIEQYIKNPRHIEVQILGDNHGNAIHLFERECSLQRRYQKIIEEAPSPTLNAEVRTKICETALKIAKEISYSNAGTIEFLVDENLNYYFLEMNTRIQVEHPVTEMITGIDIVEQQINIAQNYELEHSQKNITIKGHAIQCRIYAEDCTDNFRPAPGSISYYAEPQAQSLRIDSGISGPGEVLANFDPMISKFVVHENSRNESIKKSILLLQKYIIHGLTTNTEFLLTLLQHQNFIENKISTWFIEKNIDSINERLSLAKNEISINIFIAAYLAKTLTKISPENSSIWQTIGYWRDVISIPLEISGNSYDVDNVSLTDNKLVFNISNTKHEVEILDQNQEKLNIEFEGNNLELFCSEQAKNTSIVSSNGYTYKLKRKDILDEQPYHSTKQNNTNGDNNNVYAPMPGKVVKIEVAEGENIKTGDNLLVIEAMKMENLIKAHKDGRINKLNVTLNDSVMSDNALIEII